MVGDSFASATTTSTVDTQLLFSSSSQNHDTRPPSSDKARSVPPPPVYRLLSPPPPPLFRRFPPPGQLIRIPTDACPSRIGFPFYSCSVVIKHLYPITPSTWLDQLDSTSLNHPRDHHHHLGGQRLSITHPTPPPAIKLRSSTTILLPSIPHHTPLVPPASHPPQRSPALRLH